MYQTWSQNRRSSSSSRPSSSFTSSSAWSGMASSNVAAVSAPASCTGGSPLTAGGAAPRDPTCRRDLRVPALAHPVRELCGDGTELDPQDLAVPGEAFGPAVGGLVRLRVPD